MRQPRVLQRASCLTGETTMSTNLVTSIYDTFKPKEAHAKERGRRI